MDRFPNFPFGIAAAALFLCATLSAQPAHRWPSIFPRGKHGRTSIQTEPASPFPLGQKAPPNSTDVQFLSQGEMTEADRQLEANSESLIARRAAFQNFQLDDGRWTYRQIVCRALPNHLFLRITRDNGARDLSVFSVSISRNREGRLRVIPVLRRGYSLFSPAAGNQGTIAAFNQIRREDASSPKPGWLETALCYAALAGADPVVGPLTGDAVLNDPAPPLAEMQVLLGGSAIVRFTDQAALPHPQLWSLSFSPAGALLKVTRETAVPYTRWIVPRDWKPASEPRRVLIVQPIASKQSETNDSAPPAKPVPR